MRYKVIATKTLTYAAVSLNKGRPSKVTAASQVWMYKENHFQKEGSQSSWKWDHLRDEVSPFPSPSLPWPASNLSKSVFPSPSPPPFPWAAWFFYVSVLADLRTVLLIHLIDTNNGSVSPANYFTSLTDACLSCTLIEEESSAYTSNNNNLIKNLMHSDSFPSTGFALWIFKSKLKKNPKGKK